MEKDELVAWYEKSTTTFSKYLDEAVSLSKDLAGHFVDEKHAWGTWIFTRAVAIGINIEKLLGTCRFDKSPVSSLDYGCVGSLCRDSLETILMLLYVTEDINEEVWSLRVALFNLHDCHSREQLFRALGNKEEADRFAEDIPELRRRLQAEPAFVQLHPGYRKILSRGEKARTASTESILLRIGADIPSYKATVKLWSANIHATPLSWYRMADHAGGRGLDNARDRVYIANSLEYLTPFIKKATEVMQGQLAAIKALPQKKEAPKFEDPK